MILNEEQLTEVIKECGNVDADVLARAIIFADREISMVQYTISHSEELMGHWSPEVGRARDRWLNKMTYYQKYGVAQ